MPEAAVLDLPPTVLVVEDDALIAMMIADALEEAGYCTAWSPDGEAGMTIVPAPGAAIVDLRLGDGRDGRAVVRRLRERRPCLPVVVVTGFGANAPEADLRGLGGPTLRLHKPFGTYELLAALTAVQDALPPVPPQPPRRRRTADHGQVAGPENRGMPAARTGWHRRIVSISHQKRAYSGLRSDLNADPL